MYEKLGDGTLRWIRTPLLHILLSLALLAPLVYDPFGRACALERQGVGQGSFVPQVRYAYSDTEGTAAACAGSSPDFPVWAGLAVFRQTADDQAVSGGPYNDVDPKPGGLASYTFYDGLGRLVTEQVERNHPNANSQWATRHRQYNGLGQTATEWLAYGAGLWSGVLPSASGAVITTTYDALGRVLVTTLPDGSQSRVSYQPNGNHNKRLEVFSDANGHRTARVYDVFGRLVRVREEPDLGNPANDYAVTQYGYDVVGRLVSVTDDAGNQTSITYDAAGRKTSMTDPDMGTWYYSYDLAGNLLTQTDARGVTVSFSYDRLGRLVGKDYSDSTPDVSYCYCNSGSGKGQRCSASNSYATVSYAYDPFGRLASETRSQISGLGSNVYLTTMGYDNLDRLVQLVYPDGEVVTTSYDAGGNPYGLMGASSYVERTTYRPWGAVYRQQVGNGLWLQNTYDEVTNTRRLKTREVGTTAGGSDRLDLAYGYDLVGNLTSFTDGGVQTLFTYDHRDRLTGASGGFTASYSYDPIGNLLTKSEGGQTVVMEYTDPLHVHAPKVVNGQTWAYDASGNLLTRIEDTVTFTQQWDAENRLVQVTNQGSGETTTFAYDADGQRVKKSVGNVITYYLGNLFRPEQHFYDLDLEVGSKTFNLLIKELQSDPHLAPSHIRVQKEYSPDELESAPLLIWYITNQSIKDDYYDLYPNRDKRGVGLSYRLCPACRAPLEQVRDLILKASLMGKKDLSLTYSFDVILSGRIVRLLQEWDVTGFDLRPVQNYGKSDKGKPALYQLQVTNVLPPMAVPPTEFDPVRHCEVCGSTSRFLKHTHQWGQIRYYEETDVYYPRSVLEVAKDFNYTAEWFGELPVMKPMIIISQRLYRLLREHKVKHWEAVPVYLVD